MSEARWLVRPLHWGDRARLRSLQGGRGYALPPWWTLLGGWLPPARRWHGWVAVDRLQLKGVICACPRISPRIWEIPSFILAEPEKEIGQALLQELSQQAALRGVERLFIHLPRQSPLVEVAQACQFNAYRQECLYCGQGLAPQGEPPAAQGAFSPQGKGNDYSLFHLYTLAVPAPIRQAEGETFSQWKASQRREPTEEWLWQSEGQVLGHLRIRSTRLSREFELLCHPTQEANLEVLLRESLKLLGPGTIYCRVSHFQPSLERFVVARGFQLVAEYIAMVKQLTVPVRQARLVPVRA